MELSHLYTIENQATKISIEPCHMNSNILSNMLDVLKKKLEKKCNKNGYVFEVIEITNYSDGYLPVENLNGNAIINIDYKAKIYIPIVNTMIIACVKAIKTEIICMVGRLIIFIPEDNIDTNIWSMTNKYTNINKNKKLELNDFVKVKIISKRVNNEEKEIIAIGQLCDFPSKEEVEIYYNN